MSFSLKRLVTEAEGEVKTFVGWLVKQYTAFYKNEPTIIKTVDTVVSYAKDGLDIVLGVTGQTALAAPVDAIVTEAVTDLDRAAALVYDFGPSPTAASIFQAVQANLATLETAGHITNPATVAKIKLIINAVGTLAQIVAKAVAAATAPPAA